jgi:hypothetical protein
MSFAKLDSGIVNSTLWVQPDDVLRVWIWMLSQADANGVVRVAAPALAMNCMKSVDRIREILTLLESPDPDSRSENDEGRRLRKVSGGWQIINYRAYRAGEGDRGNAGLDAEGYIYYVGDTEARTVKIAFSKNPWSRLSDLRATHPTIELLAVEKGTGRDEKKRHSEFAALRTKGEWFRRSPELDTLIAALGRPGKEKPGATGGLRVATGSDGVDTGRATKEAEAEAEVEENQEQGSASPDGDAPPAPANDPQSAASPSADRIPYQAIMDAYNATMTGLAKARELSPKRRALIRSAWQASAQRRSVKFWQAYFDECQDDRFNNGTGPYKPPHEDWRPTFDYLLRADVVTKIFEAAMDRMERGE